MKKLSESFVTAAEARDSLAKRDIDKLTYEQKICLDFLKKYITISVEDSKKLMNELQDIGRIDERQASMIVNIMPVNKDEVKLVFSKERMTLSDEELNKVAETVKKYVK